MSLICSSKANVGPRTDECLTKKVFGSENYFFCSYKSFLTGFIKEKLDNFFQKQICCTWLLVSLLPFSSSLSLFLFLSLFDMSLSHSSLHILFLFSLSSHSLSFPSLTSLSPLIVLCFLPPSFLSFLSLALFFFSPYSSLSLHLPFLFLCLVYLPLSISFLLFLSIFPSSVLYL